MMGRKRIVRGPWQAVAFVAVALSLLFVNVYGSHDPPVGLVSQRCWIHGWPATWLHRAWVPFEDADANAIRWIDPAWPWVNAPDQPCDIDTFAAMTDVLVGTVLLVGVAGGFRLLERKGPHDGIFRTAVALLGFFVAVWGLVKGVPELTEPLAYACVYGAVLFVGSAIAVHSLRYARRRRDAQAIQSCSGDDAPSHDNFSRNTPPP